MSVESLIIQTLTGFVADRVYPDVAPQGATALPRITFSQVGGKGLNFLANAPVGKKNGNFQISCWGASRLQVSALSRQVEDALRSEGALFPTVLAAPIAVYEPAIGGMQVALYGTHQDFSFYW